MVDRIFTRDACDAIAKAVEPMLNSRLDNYIIPGLASSLVGGGDRGKVRLFSTDRDARDFVTPHSHRFEFTCLVLKGTVRNTIYREAAETGDQWCVSTINQVCGKDGLMDYKHTREDKPSLWCSDTRTYIEGETYHMEYMEIHSIQFDRHSRVLFFEGPQVISTSRMIEPWVNGKCVPTFKTEDWMFLRTGRETTTVNNGESK